jgi:hypothetical protein
MVADMFKMVDQVDLAVVEVMILQVVQVEQEILLQ